MFSLWSILGANLQEEDTRTSEEANQFNRLLQESSNVEEIILHSQFSPFIESRAIQLDKFLRKEGIIESLLELLVSSKDKNITNAASKVFSSKFAFVKSSIVNNETLMNLLFQELIDFSTSNVQHNPENNLQISSTMSAILLTHKWEVVEYITMKITKERIHLILNYPNFLLALLDQDICTTTIKLTKWIIEVGIVPLLVRTFIAGDDFHEEAAEALIQLTSFESKLQESLTKESIDSLIEATLLPSPKMEAKWVVSQVLSIFSNLVETSQVSYSSEVPESIQPIVDHIPNLVSSLDDDKSNSLSIQNTVGVIEPFGMTRMKIVSLIGNLLRLEQRSIQQKLIQSNFLLILLKLIIKYKWNNILHTKVVEIIDNILSSNIGFEFNLLEQSNIHKYIAEILLECHHVKEEKNEVLPFTSIFEKLSSIVIQYADTVTLDDLEESETWRHYRKVVHDEDINPPSYDPMEREESEGLIGENNNNNENDDDDENKMNEESEDHTVADVQNPIDDVIIHEEVPDDLQSNHLKIHPIENQNDENNKNNNNNNDNDNEDVKISDNNNEDKNAEKKEENSVDKKDENLITENANNEILSDNNQTSD